MRIYCAIGAAVMGALALAAGAVCAPIFRDGFDPGIDHNLWTIGPPTWAGQQGQQKLEGDFQPGEGANHIRTPGINSAQEYINYRVTYNSQHVLQVPYGENVYLKVWMFEDNDMPFGGYYSEYTANGYITLLDTTNAGDFLSVGAMGQHGYYKPTKVWYNNCAVETARDGAVALDGLSGRQLVPRRQGWRKYTVLVHGYTDTAGDAQLLIDDTVAYNARRLAALPPDTGGAPFDTIVLGSRFWTFETYWFDDVDFGTIETPVACSTIAEAKAQPDGAWVELDAKVVSGQFTKNPFPGYFALEEDDRSAGLWVSSSYQAQVAGATHEAEKVRVRGIMYTNLAGMRYLDAILVTQEQTLAPQPGILGCALRSLEDEAIHGMLVKVWGEVVGRGQERSGDWRRYILISDGSANAPVKCYYDNIISGVDPVPNVNNGDYVSVVGVAGKEVLVSGDAAQVSVWIRKAGDLAIVLAGP